MAGPFGVRPFFCFRAMNLDHGLILRALERHVRMAQQAMDFALQHRKGDLYSQASEVLAEAVRAKTQLERWIKSNRKNGF